MKRYQLTQPAFIAATLLTEGSIITDADLGTIDGKPVNPPRTAIEIDANGNPVDDAGADLLASTATGEPALVPPPAPVDPAPEPAPAEPDAAAAPQAAEAPKRRGAAR